MLVPPVTVAIAQPSERPRHETESFMKVAKISFGCSTKIAESTVHPFTSTIFTVCNPAGAFVLAFIPPKLQLKLYEGVPPVADT